MVNSNKKLSRMASNVEKLQREHEEIENRKFELQEEGKQTLAALHKAVRELENEKERIAYLSSQSAQETGALVGRYVGARGAAEAFRRLAQETQQHHLVPQIDLLFRMAALFDPAEHHEEEDPLLLGVDISEEDQSAEAGDDSSISDEMEGIREEARGKKRQLERWENRWESAEERERGARGTRGDKRNDADEADDDDSLPPLESDSELGTETRKAEEALKESKAVLEYTVEANRQMEEQENLQRQQDREVAVRQAASEVEARLRGQVPNRWAAGPPKIPPRNPRLDVDTTRQRACIPSKELSSGSEMELEDEESKRRAKEKRRKDNSRSPRGRMLDRVD